MRLHKHEELVEAMARARANTTAKNMGISGALAWKMFARDFLEEETAALDALLDAAVELGVGRECKACHFTDGTVWPSLILRLEARTDDA